MLTNSILFSDSFVTWVLLIPTVYLVLNVFFRLGKWWPQTAKGTCGANIAAYEITSCLVCFFVGAAGSFGWFKLCHWCDFESIENDRIYGRSEYFERHLAAPLLSYQLWNFVICLVIGEMREGVMLVHHFASGLCALFSVHPFLQYYGLFFFGVPEVTSVPLTFVSMSKFFPFLKKDYPEIYELSKWSFGVQFLLVRLVMWTYVSVFFWIDILHLVRGGAPHSMLVVGYYCIANVVLTGMQYFWGYKIVKQMSHSPDHEMVKSTSTRKEK